MSNLLSPRDMYTVAIAALDAAADALRSIRDAADPVNSRYDRRKVALAQELAKRLGLVIIAAHEAGHPQADLAQATDAARIVVDGIYGPVTFRVLRTLVRALPTETANIRGIDTAAGLRSELRAKRALYEDYWTSARAHLVTLRDSAPGAWPGGAPQASTPATPTRAPATAPLVAENPPPQVFQQLPQNAPVTTDDVARQTTSSAPLTPPASSLEAPPAPPSASAPIELPGAVVRGRPGPTAPIEVEQTRFNPVWLATGLGLAAFAGVVLWGLARRRT